MLGEVAASLISTAELEMQAAPAAAAPAGGSVLVGMMRNPRNVMTKSALWCDTGNCGNRQHVAAYRERLYRDRRSGAAAEAETA